MTELLEKKLRQLKEGMKTLEQNITAQAGAIQVVEQLIAEAAEQAEKTAALVE